MGKETNFVRNLRIVHLMIWLVANLSRSWSGTVKTNQTHSTFDIPNFRELDHPHHSTFFFFTSLFYVIVGMD